MRTSELINALKAQDATGIEVKTIKIERRRKEAEAQELLRKEEVAIDNVFQSMYRRMAKDQYQAGNPVWVMDAETKLALSTEAADLIGISKKVFELLVETASETGWSPRLECGTNLEGVDVVKIKVSYVPTHKSLAIFD